MAVTRRSYSLARLRKNRLAVLGLGLLGLFIFSAALGPVLAPHDPYAQSLSLRLRSPGWSGDPGVFVLGTDQMGRDVLSRLIVASRISLGISFVSTAGAGALGLALGLLAGYQGRLADAMVMRLVDLQLSFPLMLLALTVVGLLGPSIRNLVIVFVITGWPVYARVVRSSVLALKEWEFVQAARAIGAGDVRIVLRHLLPNLLNPLIVIASFELARVIILEASISFLGLGVQPPTPTWGNMLAEGRDYIRDAWWLATWPGLAIAVLVASINFVGDGLRDALDPRAT